MLSVGIVVLVGIGGRRLGRIDTVADLSDLRIRRIVDRMVARRRAVRVDLQTVAQLIDHRQIRRIGAAVLDADAVRRDDGILDRTDVRVQISIRIHCRAGCAVRIRSRRNALIQRAGIGINTADLFLRRGSNRDGIAAAVDLCDLADVDQHLIGAAEAVARSDQIDHRRAVVGGIDFRFISVDNRTGAVRSGDRNNIQNIAAEFHRRRSTVIQDCRIGGRNGIVRQASQMTAVGDSICGSAGDGTVVYRTDLCQGTLIIRSQITAVILCCCKLGRTGIVTYNITFHIRPRRCINQHILCPCQCTVLQCGDNAQVAESKGLVLCNRHIVDRIDRGRYVIVMIRIRCDIQALVSERFTGQGISGLTAVAVQEHRIAFPCSRRSSCEVRVLQCSDMALVLQQLIAVGAGADKVNTINRVNNTAFGCIPHIRLNTLRFGRGICIIRVGTNKIIAGQRTGTGVQQRVVVRRHRQAAADRADLAAVHDTVISPCSDRTGSVDSCEF